MARLRFPSFSSSLTLLAGIVAVVATLGFANAIMKNSWTTSSLPSADAAPSPSSPTAPNNSSYPSDARGFLNSSARCEAPLTAVAIVRTEGSLIAICADQKNTSQYRGVRLSDGATLNVPVETTGAREFVARNDGATYSLSTKELVITSGDTLIRRESVLEYKEPNTFPAEAPPTR